MKGFRMVTSIIVTIIVISVVCATENHCASLEKAVQFEDSQTYLRLQEWERAVNTISIAVPIVAIILVIVIWWNPLKQLWR